jgi:hypothetical protein
MFALKIKDAFNARWQISGIYFTISTVPPAASMAALAFALTAFTLKVNLPFNSPLPSILTLSNWLISRLCINSAG